MAWHQGGFVPLGDVVQGVVFKYPLMPWIGLMAAGYAIGPVFQREPASRQRFLWIAAAVLMVAFVALRASNLYGDPRLFTSTGRGAMFDLMAFVNLEKYPPSLLYLMVTGSIGLALLAIFDRIKPVGFLQLIGRVPMFFYVIHIALFHMLGNLYFNLRFGGTPNFDGNNFVLPPGYVPSLAVVYAAWLLLMVVMYWLCSYWTRREDRRMVARAAA
jgi:uncharacterized membrane protein